MAESLLVPVVLSGGSGTRLWPVSREKHPKQLQPLLGGESLLQNTLRRLEGLPLAAPIVVSNQEYRFITAEQLRELGLPGWSLLLEPAGRNTAPALTAAALYSIRNGADPVLLATPADHHVRNAGRFCEAVLGGLAEAQRGAVVTFGIVPDRPETGYGYIETASGAGSAAGTPVDLLGFRRKTRCRNGRGLRGRRKVTTGTAESSCCAPRFGSRPSATWRRRSWPRAQRR
jgi:mannose-1-phosphate guanylyltransferase/mannose-6-phosphate isomerase